MVKITLENGTVLEGSVEELRQMGVKFADDVKPLEVGDYAKVVSATNYHVLSDGDIVEVVEVAKYFSNNRLVKRLSDNKKQYVPLEQLIHATDEEVAEAKKPAQPETITHEGVEYKRVDREAREGDVVVVRETDDCDLTVGKAYVVTENLGDSDGGVIDDIGENNAVLSDSEKFDVYEPIVAKPAPLQVGDYAKVVGNEPTEIYKDHQFALGEIVEIGNEATFENALRCDSLGAEECQYDFVNPINLVRATDEEVAESKRQQAEKAVADKWAEIGRKPNEFKVGDAVQYKKAFTTVSYVGPKYIRIRQSSNVEHNIAVNPANLTLVFPVESKFGGDSE